MRPKMYDEEIIKICRHKHYPASTILKIIQKKYPSVGQATIYRTLKYLTKKGLLIKIKGLGVCAYYETSIGTHGHAVDNQTGKIYDFTLPGNFLTKIKLPLGFNISNADIKIYGNIEASEK